MLLKTEVDGCFTWSTFDTNFNNRGVNFSENEVEVFHPPRRTKSAAVGKPLWSAIQHGEKYGPIWKPGQTFLLRYRGMRELKDFHVLQETACDLQKWKGKGRAMK